ncbi:MAG: AsmA-like C-terminal region-containing protein [Candidatus Acidiferrales bacterium]
MKLSKPLTIVLGILGGVLLAYCVIFAISLEWASRHGREFVMQQIQKRFHGEVQLDSINIKVYPSVQVTGTGVVVLFKGREDLPPLISIKSFTAQANWLELMRLPRHISHVTLVGLQITVPAGIHRIGEDSARPRISLGHLHGVFLDDIEANDATLSILPKQAGKEPQVYDIASLHAHTTSADGEVAFEATLRIPVPPGDVLTRGSFGPWDVDAPGLTPVSGSFTYDNADLGHFKGISGILSAKGSYDGELEQIAVDGATDTPDFSVDSGGHPVHLTTTFHAVVDGVNGDTALDPVDAHFRHTTLHTTGIIAGTPGQRGKAVRLQVSTAGARVEDLLLLAVKDEPAMTGDVQLHTAFLLPARSKDEVLNRLFLDGAFSVDKVVFTNHGIEQKVDKLSMRSSGDTGAVPEGEDVATEMQGQFRLEDGVISFSDLNFRVPGANVNVAGTFGLDNQALDLHGTFDMQAKLSQTTTGVKSFLLRAVNPFFAKPGGGSRIPFKIGGTAKDPVYALDRHYKNGDNSQTPTKSSSAEARGN